MSRMRPRQTIKVLDKVNNHHWEIFATQSVVIHPHGHPTVIDEYRREGFYISGIIFHPDGSTEVLSKKVADVRIAEWRAEP